MEKFTFFWNGPFSQWYRCNFKVNNIDYNTAEQFMMAQKAITFHDEKTFNKILKSTSPKEQKALGRQVHGFNEVEWNQVARNIVYRGNYAKFTQNKKLGELLLATNGTTLVEASPYDKIWGIGLDAKDPRALNRNTWQGKNWLGEVLTNLREDLILQHS